MNRWNNLFAFATAVIPAKAGIQTINNNPTQRGNTKISLCLLRGAKSTAWIPAFAGMTRYQASCVVANYGNFNNRRFANLLGRKSIVGASLLAKISINSRASSLLQGVGFSNGQFWIMTIESLTGISVLQQIGSIVSGDLDMFASIDHGLTTRAINANGERHMLIL